MTVRGRVESLMLWVAFPGLLLPAAVSVSAAAAAGAVGQRFATLELPPGIEYQFPIWFAFVVFASMVLNLVIALTYWPTAPDRGMPLVGGIIQLALLVVLAFWTAHFVWEALYRGALGGAGAVSPFQDLAFFAPVICIGLSLASFTMILVRRRTKFPRGSSTLFPPARIGMIVYLALAAVALLVRFALPLDSTAQNATNWMLVVLGAPISVLAAPITWIVGQNLIGQVDAGAASLGTAALFAVPVLINAAWVLSALLSARFRARWVPLIALT